MGKVKTEENLDNSVADVSMKEEGSYESKLKHVSIIAKPMASKKLTKKCYKLIKKAVKHKTYVRNGLKDVQMRIRKGEKGLVIFAGDVTPVDIMCHLPAVCEEKDIPYCFTPSRTDLGAALGAKRGCLMVLVRENEEYKEAYDECKAELKNLAVEL
ncbi:PREDICTED: H/ACA ribonucleoprotein complex subunit 2-like protein [Nicrophorus vespilloides]|uniref:H/ACA ribonucleoprotein complex subunit 2-like protein n=1 Tax=Nicrophorus vespilloides TaxID=110193 RepID=A0ABM1MIZ2_NICVS|nr:PREDICTED: H/ACA ribonucleoprotein complex subunit 2-like protein [Nicrophorus vespilloides]